MRLKSFFAWVLLLTLAACRTVEETGRRQFMLLNENSEIEMGLEAYRQALEKAPISQDKGLNDLVRRVGMRIAEASRRSDYQWEFKVIEDLKTVNAWALPGGKVAVYTGILKVTQDEAGLATVLGHEVAHATARHGGERITRQLTLKLGETALAVGLQTRDPGITNAVMSAFGVGSQVGLVLPFSRKQELEADEIGLLYMARAGYDPEKSIEFWQRMAVAEAQKNPPEFLSTHPNTHNRIEHLRELMPKAKEEYRQARPAAISSPPPPPSASGTPAPPR